MSCISIFCLTDDRRALFIPGIDSLMCCTKFVMFHQGNVSILITSYVVPSGAKSDMSEVRY